MGFRRAGDWDRAANLIGNVGAEMLIARNKFLKQWGLKAERIAVTHMSKQDLNWVALAASTLAEKIRKGFSENILIRTSTYFQSITSWHIGNTVYAGVRKEVKDDDGNIVADIAATHEYGSRSGKIPARPLWQPTFKETQDWAANNSPEKMFLNTIRQRYGI